MRVLMFSECPWNPTSMGKITLWLAIGLQRLGIDVKIVCPAGIPNLLCDYVKYRPGDYCRHLDGYEIEVYPWCGSLAQHVYDVKPDVVLVYGTPYAPPLHEVLPQCKSLPVPVAGYFISETMILPPEYALYVENVAVFATPTSFVRQTIVDGLSYAGYDREELLRRSMVVRHGIDLRAYRPEACRDAPRYSNRILIGMIGKNMIRKCAYVLLRALAEVLKSKPDCCDGALFLTGFAAGDTPWHYDALISLVEMQTGVRLRGRVLRVSDPFYSRGLTEPQLIELYCSIDIFAFPSMGESFGLPPLEAAALGKPIVVSKHPALIEIWRDAIPEDLFVECREFVTTEGLLLCYPDHESMARILLRLVEDEKLRRELAERVHRHAQGFDYETMAREMLRLLELAVEQKKPIAESVKRVG